MLATAQPLPHIPIQTPIIELSDSPIKTCKPGLLSPKAIRNQMKKIFAHPEFAYSDRLKAFLQFIIEETLAGRTDQLKEFTIGLEVFGRKSFDPQNDTIVRVMAGNLRRRLKQFYLTDGRHDPIFLEIPKGSYIPTFRGNISTFQAQNGNGNSTTGQDPEHGLISLLPSKPSIAVLPLTNIDQKPTQESLCDGLTEEIGTRLVQIPELFVLGRTTTIQYKGQAVDINKLSRELGIQYVLTGSLRKAGAIVRVTVQLVDATSGGQLWADKYDRTWNTRNLFKTQDEVAKKIVAAVVDIIVTNRPSQGQATK